MDSSLSPRDIQARIRAGETVEGVARAAGVPTERIEAFAGPVLAERDHVAGLAQQSPVRRSGENESKRLLRSAAAERFKQAQIDASGVEWDAFLIGARRWQVSAAYQRDGEPRTASFVHDQAGRFSVPADDEGRWLAGEDLAPAEPEPAEPDQTVTSHLPATERPSDAYAGVESDPDDEDADDAYAEGELREIDGVYEIVSSTDETDAVLDMLSGYDEDSVRIYSGLVSPTSEPAAPSVWSDPSAGVEAPFALDEADGDPSSPAPRPADAAPDPTPSTPAPSTTDPSTPDPAPKRRARPAVPSWDEIMFGAPRRDDERS